MTIPLNTPIQVVTKQNVSVPSGVAGLDATTRLIPSELPLGVLYFQGTWDSSTNSPALVDGTGTYGYAYFITVAGSTPLGSVTNWAVGDIVYYTGSVWAKIGGSSYQTRPTGSVITSKGTTAERDASPLAGYLRFNTSLNYWEGYDGVAWNPIGAIPSTPGNPVFLSNDPTVNVSVTLPPSKNTMSAGPITVPSGVVVTVPAGSTWSVI
jgi:hypothetical protein